MLAKVIHEITKITDNNNINLENYMESINFINNAYSFINKIKMITPISNIHFEPSFKGRMTCEKFNLEVHDEKECEMKYFITKSVLFLEDKEVKKEMIRDTLGPICESIEFDGEIIRFLLK